VEVITSWDKIISLETTTIMLGATTTTTTTTTINSTDQVQDLILCQEITKTQLCS